MDPQATIQRIKDCIDDNDFDGFHESVVDLRDWLARGGFAPVVTMETFGSRITIARLPSRTFHIQTVVSDESLVEEKPVRFELAEYNGRGDRVGRWFFSN